MKHEITTCDYCHLAGASLSLSAWRINSAIQSLVNVIVADVSGSAPLDFCGLTCVGAYMHELTGYTILWQIISEMSTQINTEREIMSQEDVSLEDLKGLLNGQAAGAGVHRDE